MSNFIRLVHQTANQLKSSSSVVGNNDSPSTQSENHAARSRASERARPAPDLPIPNFGGAYKSPSPRESRKRSASLELITTAKRVHRKHQISEDERRLCGDYTLPKDAVKVPKPEEWAFDRSPEPMKSHKPGANVAPKPVNTISRGNVQNSARKPSRGPLTYGITNRNTTLRGSRAFEETFLDHESGSLSGPGTVLSPLLRNGTSSSRRKKRSQDDSEVISIVDDDDGDDAKAVLEVSSSSLHSSRALLAKPSKRRGSTDIQAGRGFGQLCEPHDHSGIGSPAPKRQRIDGSSSGVGQSSISSKKMTETLKRSPVSTESWEVQGKSEVSSQGRHLSSEFPNEDDQSDVDELQAGIPSLNSRHTLSKHVNVTSRINSSTSAKNDRQRARPQASIVHAGGNGPIGATRTEMQMTLEELTGTSLSRDGPPNLRKRMPQSHNGSKSTGELEFRLAYARSYNIEERKPGLFLYGTPTKDMFMICVSRGDSLDQIASMDVRKCHKASADDLRIRLTGPSSQGEQYWYDLQFVDKHEFVSFCRFHVEPNMRQNIIFKHETDYMEKIFAKPLHRNDKLETAGNLNNKNEVRGGSHRRTLGRAEQDNDDESMNTSSAKDSTKAELTVTGSGQGVASLTSLRPTRSTRTSKGLRDDDFEREGALLKKPSKYSEEQGLGPRWSKPLQYGIGRHRALVNFDDLLRLDEDEMLNDDLVDFYLIYLFDQAKVPRNTVYYFNSHFFTTLTRSIPGQKGEINYSGVQKWVKEDIFTYDYIVVPVCENSHWYLAIICNAPNIIRRPVVEDLSNSPSTVKSNKTPFESTQSDQRSDGKEICPASAGTSKDNNETASQDSIVVLHTEAGRGDLPQPIGKEELTEHPATDARESSLEETEGLQRLSIDDSLPEKISIPKGIIGDTPATPMSNKKKSNNNKKKPAQPRKYSPDQPIILILDSLGSPHPKTSRALKEYILREGLTKRGMEARIEQNVFYVRDNHIPMQQNFTDCGVYLLGYAQKFFEDPAAFVSKILLRDMDPDIDWPDMSAMKIRDAMRDILLKLGVEQGLTRPKKKRPKPTAPPALPAGIRDPPSKTSRLQTTTAELGMGDQESHSTPNKKSLEIASQRMSPRVVVPANERSPTKTSNSQRLSIITDMTLPLEIAKSPGRRVKGPQMDENSHVNELRRLSASPAPPGSSSGAPQGLSMTSSSLANKSSRGPRFDTVEDESSTTFRGSSVDPIPIDDSQGVHQRSPAIRKHNQSRPDDPAGKGSKHGSEKTKTVPPYFPSKGNMRTNNNNTHSLHGEHNFEENASSRKLVLTSHSIASNRTVASIEDDGQHSSTAGPLGDRATDSYDTDLEEEDSLVIEETPEPVT